MVFFLFNLAHYLLYVRLYECLHCCFYLRWEFWIMSVVCFLFGILCLLSHWIPSNKVKSFEYTHNMQRSIQFNWTEIRKQRNWKQANSRKNRIRNIYTHTHQQISVSHWIRNFSSRISNFKAIFLFDRYFFSSIFIALRATVHSFQIKLKLLKTYTSSRFFFCRSKRNSLMQHHTYKKRIERYGFFLFFFIVTFVRLLFPLIHTEIVYIVCDSHPIHIIQYIFISIVLLVMLRYENCVHFCSISLILFLERKIKENCTKCVIRPHTKNVFNQFCKQLKSISVYHTTPFIFAQN